MGEHDTSERAARKSVKAAVQDQHSKSIFRNTLQGQSAWQRHMAYVERYLKRYERDGGEARRRALATTFRNDWDVLKERHRFLRDDEGAGPSSGSTSTYDDEVAKKYYQSLFKDMVLADLKHYKSGNVAFRWRAEEDVIDGVGQFTCANIRCEQHKVRVSSSDLTAYEVNFRYAEPGNDDDAVVYKNALVKAVLCGRCGRKLRYKSDRERQSDRKPERRPKRNASPSTSPPRRRSSRQ